MTVGNGALGLHKVAAQATSTVSLYRQKLARFVDEVPFFRAGTSQPLMFSQLDARLPFVYVDPRLSHFNATMDRWPTLGQLVAGDVECARVGYLLTLPNDDPAAVRAAHAAGIEFARDHVAANPTDAFVVFLPGFSGVTMSNESISSSYLEAIAAVCDAAPDAKHLVVGEPKNEFAAAIRTLAATRYPVDLLEPAAW